eukprot:6471556-Prymnesium_polylepis.1
MLRRRSTPPFAYREAHVMRSLSHIDSSAGAGLVHQRAEVIDRRDARRHGGAQPSRECGHAIPPRTAAMRSSRCAHHRRRA